VVFLFFVVLQWLETVAERGCTAGISINKMVVVSHLLLCGCYEVKLFPAGRGGEEEKRRRVVSCAVVLLLARRGGEGEKYSGAASTTYRRWRFSGCAGALFLAALSPISGHHGGGGWRQLAAVQSGSSRRAVESAPVAAAPKRRRFAEAIRGHQNGPAAPEIDFDPGSLILLQWRIKSDLVAALHVATSPSGAVPGGGNDGRDCRSKLTGCSSRLDCFSAICCRVFSTKKQDYDVISVFFRVLSVNVRPPP
jgi:hypothetical protein